MKIKKIRNLKIDHNLGYDYDMGAINFNENFKILHSSYSKNSILQYTNFENLPEYDLDDINLTIRENNSNLRKLAKALLEVDGLNDTIENIISKYNCNDLWYELAYNMDIDKKLEYADEIGVTYEFDFEMMVSRGYSQGDYSEIWVNTTDYKRVFGAEFDAQKEQKIIDHILWDSPIYGELTISFEWTNEGGVNYSELIEFKYIDEILKCGYEANIDTAGVLANIEKQINQVITGEAKKQIITVLEKIDYTDVKYPCAC